MRLSLLLIVGLLALFALQADAYDTLSRRKVTGGTKISRTNGLASGSACADLCVANPQCTHAGASRRRNANTWTCSLYSAVTTHVDAPRTVLYVMTAAAPPARVYHQQSANTVSIAAPFAQRKERNLDICKRACDMEPTCGAVSQHRQWCRFHSLDATPSSPVPYTVWVTGVPGCKDTAATNYNSVATIDDGSCTIPSTDGCGDMNAVNYDPSVVTHNAAMCTYPDPFVMTPYPGQKYSGGVYVRRINGANKAKCQEACIKRGDECHGVNSIGSKCYVYSTNHHEQGSIAANAKTTYYAKETVGCTNSSALNFDATAQVESSPSTCRFSEPGSLSGGSSSSSPPASTPTPAPPAATPSPPPPAATPPPPGEDLFPNGNADLDLTENEWEFGANTLELRYLDNYAVGLGKGVPFRFNQDVNICPQDAFISSCMGISQISGAPCNAFYDYWGTCEENGSGGCQQCSSGDACECKDAVLMDDLFQDGNANIVNVDNTFGRIDFSNIYGGAANVSVLPSIVLDPAVQRCPSDVYVDDCSKIIASNDVKCANFYDDNGTCLSMGPDPFDILGRVGCFSCNAQYDLPCPCAANYDSNYWVNGP